MNFSDPSDIAGIVGVLVVLLSFSAWIVRRWIRDQIERQVIPSLREHEHSIAQYDHDARVSADAAQESAVTAKSCALDAKSAALSAADAARSAESAAASMSERE